MNEETKFLSFELALHFFNAFITFVITVLLKSCSSQECRFKTHFYAIKMANKKARKSRVKTKSICKQNTWNLLFLWHILKLNLLFLNDYYFYASKKYKTSPKVCPPLTFQPLFLLLSDPSSIPLFCCCSPQFYSAI